jgi:hypothetical protein
MQSTVRLVSRGCVRLIHVKRLYISSIVDDAYSSSFPSVAPYRTVPYRTVLLHCVISIIDAAFLHSLLWFRHVSRLNGPPDEFRAGLSTRFSIESLNGPIDTLGGFVLSHNGNLAIGIAFTQQR